MHPEKYIVRAGQMVCSHDTAKITDGAVAVVGNTIADVGAFSEIQHRFPGLETIGDERFLLIPGLINGHGHGRGLSDFQRGALDNTLESWLFDTRKYLPVRPYDDLAYSAVRLLKSGVTTTMHNHLLSAPGRWERELQEGLQAYRDAGIRVQFNPGVRDSNPFIYGDNEEFVARLPQDLQRLLRQPPPANALAAENFVDAVSALHASYDSDMSRIGFGPLAPQWCSVDLLQEVRRAAEKLKAPIHLHAVQTIYQKVYGETLLGKTLIRHLDDIGFLGKGVVLGHCVWPTEDDIETLVRTGTAVTHHPSCNLRVRNGIAPVFHMLQAGVVVGLGLDGKGINDDDDMLQEMKVCFLLHRLPSLELDSEHLRARQVFQMATANNAVLLGFEKQVGRLAPGYLADMVLIDYQAMTSPYTDPAHDPIDVLLYRGKARHVHTVIVNGRVVVRNGQVLTIDEKTLAERLAQAAARPRTAAQNAVSAGMEELKAAVKTYYRGWPERIVPAPFFMTNSRK